jgi:hypothetical protein
MIGLPTPMFWAGCLLLSVVADAGATAYLKAAGDRIDGAGFFGATLVGVAAFAPSIVLFGYALRSGPSYIATVGIWAVGVYTVNAVVGLFAFGDSFNIRVTLGIVTASLTVMLLKPA